MKPVFVSLNAKYVHAGLAPWYLAAACRQAGWEPVVLERTIGQDMAEASQAIAALCPDVVGICCYIWNIQQARELTRALKRRLPRAVVVVGGPEVSFRPQALLQSWPEISYVVCGEGEQAFPSLLVCLEAGQEPTGVPGVYYRTGRESCGGMPPEFLKSDPPSPYDSGYLSSLHGRMAYLETSRGCPFSCAFCLSGQKDPVRFFDLDKAKEHLVLLANSGAKTIKLVDRTFNCRPDRAYALWRFILENAGTRFPSNVCFHFEIGADLLDARTLALLAKAPAGLLQVEAGLQSFEEKTLSSVMRKTSLSRLVENLTTLIGFQNIHVHIDLLAGLPYEGIEAFARSFNKAFALRPHMLQMGFLKLLHGSALDGMAQDNPAYGYVFEQEAPYQVRQTAWLSAGEMARLEETEDALERLYNSGRFIKTVTYLLQTTGQAPFALFSDLGQALAAQGPLVGLSLDAYTERLYRYAKSLPGVAEKALRDVLVVDRLSCENTGWVPPFLRVEDKRYRAARRWAKEAFPQTRTGVALLYADKEAVATFDYTQKHRVTGRYPCSFWPMDVLA